MRTWSDWPFDATVPVGDVHAIAGIVAEHRGESSIIYEIGGYPGWLAKRYKSAPSDRRQDELDKLIRLPGQMNAEDRHLVDKTVSWPVARITEGTTTHGVVIAKAPDSFFHDLVLLEGRRKRAVISIDHLAMADDYYLQRGLPSPGLAGRLAIVRSLISVGDLLERNRLVYGDWSYANAFWSPTTLKAFVIDVDSCGFGGRPWVESNAWDDPLVAYGETLSTYTDRYKLILLAARCLSGRRAKDSSLLTALPPSLRGTPLEHLLSQGLSAASLSARPSLPELLTAIDQASGHASDVKWMPIQPLRSAQTGRQPVAAAGASPLDAGANVSSWEPVPARTEPSPVIRPAASGPAPSTRPAAQRPPDIRPPGYPATPRPSHYRRSRTTTAVITIIAILAVLAIVFLAFR